MNRRSLLVVFAGLGILWACNENDPRPPALVDFGTPNGSGGGGGSSGADGGTSGGLDGGFEAGSECTDLDDPVTIITQNGTQEAPVPGVGGEIIDGVYDLVQAERYVGPSGLPGPTFTTFREVIEIESGTLSRIRITQLDNGPLATSNVAFALQATSPNLVLTPRCPTSGPSETFSYTIQNGRLTLSSPTSGESFTFVARP